MSKLDDFLGRSEGPGRPDGVEWYAVVRCQVCNAYVDEQTLYPAERILIWTCPDGHRSYLEDYLAF